MITLWLKGTRTLIGTVDEADLRLLVDQLEEESETDVDYYISPATIGMLRQNGASAQLIGLLEQAVGDSEGVDIVWAQE
jgi:hypothetical protein